MATTNFQLSITSKYSIYPPRPAIRSLNLTSRSAISEQRSQSHHLHLSHPEVAQGTWSTSRSLYCQFLSINRVRSGNGRRCSRNGFIGNDQQTDGSATQEDSTWSEFGVWWFIWAASKCCTFRIGCRWPCPWWTMDEQCARSFQVFGVYLWGISFFL